MVMFGHSQVEMESYMYENMPATCPHKHVACQSTSLTWMCHELNISQMKCLSQLAQGVDSLSTWYMYKHSNVMDGELDIVTN